MSAEVGSPDPDLTMAVIGLWKKGQGDIAEKMDDAIRKEYPRSDELLKVCVNDICGADSAVWSAAEAVARYLMEYDPMKAYELMGADE